jgi:uncharacterized membrane protein YfcA
LSKVDGQNIGLSARGVTWYSGWLCCVGNGMDLLDYHSVLLFFVALIANGLSAMAGGGAGLLQLPVLIFMGLPFGIALATHKIASVALGIGSTLRYRKENLFDWPFVLIILAFGLPGVVLGAAIILQVHEGLATISLGLLTLGLGLYSIFKKELGQYHQPQHRDMKGIILGGVVIFFIGFINGSLTSGTGMFATLWFVYWFGMDYKRAVVMTMILVGFFWNGTGAITLSLLGEVKWAWLIPLIAGSLVGGYLGAMVAVKKGNLLIKRLFELLTITTGLSLIVRAL